MSAPTDETQIGVRKRMFVVFALDGTLALTEHRADFLNWPGSTKDWRGFYLGSIFPQEVAT